MRPRASQSSFGSDATVLQDMLAHPYYVAVFPMSIEGNIHLFLSLHVVVCADQKDHHCRLTSG